MLEPPVAADEARRLKRLAELEIMDTPADPALDHLTALAATYFDMPIALVCLIDEQRQWWKSAVGLPQGGQTSRSVSFCGHAIATSELFEIEDARLDPRFADNPFVIGSPHVIHYAGMPLVMPAGERIGTVCVVSHQPGKLTRDAREMLAHLAVITVNFLLLRERERKAIHQVQTAVRGFDNLPTINAMPQVLWVASGTGKMEYVNERWYELTGAEKTVLQRPFWSAVVHPDDHDSAQRQWERGVAAGVPFELELRLRHADGSYRWMLGQARPLCAPDGTVRQWIGTCTDIHAQHTVYERLQKSDRQKDNFMAVLAHELRNPLTPIRSSASLLMQQTDPVMQRVGRIVSRQSNHLEMLVNDLLDVSRVARGLVKLDLNGIDLREIAKAALEQVASLIADKKHSVHIRASADPLLVRGDPARLTQVVTNLLTNAIKYTPSPGRIEVTLHTDGDSAVIRVTDNGQGIDPQLIPHVFELFSQEERSSDWTAGGLGVGLALVRGLVELHGGQVTVHSAGKGHGATFSVHLPRLRLS